MSCSYRFGNCRIDPARRELWRDGRLVPLPPLSFDFLAYLIEHHDRAVGRDEVVAAVWGKTDVSDTQLGQTVLRLRRELGDDARQQRLLRTVPRFGYHWVAPLQMDGGGESAAAAEIALPTRMEDAAVPSAPLPVSVAQATHRRRCRQSPRCSAAPCFRPTWMRPRNGLGRVSA